jgi:transcriptional regulator with XRE-family HTH domain
MQADRYTWPSILQLRTSTELRARMASLLRREIERAQLQRKDAAARLGIDAGTLSRWCNGDKDVISREGARRIDRHLPLDADFTMEDLRDLYVVLHDREQELATDSLPRSLARFSFCSLSGIYQSLPLVVEPVSQDDKLCYVLFTAADPILAHKVGRSFLQESVELGQANNVTLLSVDHLMGRWDICFKYRVLQGIDPKFVFSKLYGELAENDIFPRGGVRTRRVQGIESHLMGKLITVSRRAPLLDALDFAVPEYAEIRVRIPPLADYDTLRILRTFFFVDFQQVRDHEDRVFLLERLHEISIEPNSLGDASLLESCNLGEDELILEIVVVCGNAHRLTYFNRRFEEEINQHLNVQKYNLMSYEHENLWISAPIKFPG